MQLLDKVMLARHASNPTGSFTARRWDRHRTAGVAAIPSQCVGTLVHNVDRYLWVVKFEDELVTVNVYDLVLVPSELPALPPMPPPAPTAVCLTQAEMVREVLARYSSSTPVPTRAPLLSEMSSEQVVVLVAASNTYWGTDNAERANTEATTVVPDSGQERPPDPVWEEFVSST